jgi:hypothetical protein
MNTAAAKIGTHAHPTQCGIIESSLGPTGSRMKPGHTAGWSVAIHRGKHLVR